MVIVSKALYRRVVGRRINSVVNALFQSNGTVDVEGRIDCSCHQVFSVVTYKRHGPQNKGPPTATFHDPNLTMFPFLDLSNYVQIIVLFATTALQRWD